MGMSVPLSCPIFLWQIGSETVIQQLDKPMLIKNGKFELFVYNPYFNPKGFRKYIETFWTCHSIFDYSKI